MTDDLKNENCENSNNNCCSEDSHEHKCCCKNSCTESENQDCCDNADYNPAKELLEKIDELQKAAQDNKDMYLREVAAFDTYRRRMQRELLNTTKFAAIPLVESLLPTLDNLDLAIANVKAHLDPAWATGIEMVAKQIKSVFTQHNLTEINPAIGEDFDPNFAEAISQMPSDDIEEGKVAQVARIGYRIEDRLIRPASVVISKGKA